MGRGSGFRNTRNRVGLWHATMTCNYDMQLWIKIVAWSQNGDHAAFKLGCKNLRLQFPSTFTRLKPRLRQNGYAVDANLFAFFQVMKRNPIWLEPNLTVLFSQIQPSFQHSIRVQRNRIDTLFNQPSGKVFMIRRSLTANTNVFAFSFSRLNRHR